MKAPKSWRAERLIRRLGPRVVMNRFFKKKDRATKSLRVAFGPDESIYAILYDKDGSMPTDITAVHEVTKDTMIAVAERMIDLDIIASFEIDGEPYEMKVTKL